MPRILSVFVVLLAALGGCSSEAPRADEPVVGAEGGIDRSHAGAAMPQIDILAPDGETVALSQVAGGEPILINLWASWCAPCVEELPTLAELSTLEAEGIPHVLPLSQDMGPGPSVRAFLDEQGLDEIEVWQDPKMAFSTALPVAVMPTTILYDAQGREVWRFLGDRDWSDAEAIELVNEAF